MSNYHIAIDRDGNYDLAHYGVPGMKWKNHIYSHNESEQLTGRGRFRGGKSLAAYEVARRRNGALKTNVTQTPEQRPINTTSYYAPSSMASKKDDEKKEASPRAVSRGIAVREVSEARLRGRAFVDSVMKTAASAASSVAKKGQEILDRLLGRKR